MRDGYYLTSETGCRCDCCSASVAQHSAPKPRQPGRGGWWRAGWWPMGRAAWGKLGANPWCARLQQRPFSLSLFLALNSLTLFFFFVKYTGCQTTLYFFTIHCIFCMFPWGDPPYSTKEDPSLLPFLLLSILFLVLLCPTVPNPWIVQETPKPQLAPPS